MGLGAGGRMKQKIYPDDFGLDSWDAHNTARLYVHIVNSELWREITGEAPPPSPVTAKEYAARGLPWFDLYDEHAPSLKGTRTLKGARSVKELDAEKHAATARRRTCVAGPTQETVECADSAGRAVVSVTPIG